MIGGMTVAGTTITKANAKEAFAAYGMIYTETGTDESGITSGSVQVGDTKEGFKWSKAGTLPARGKVWLLLRTEPRFATDHPKAPGKAGKSGSANVAPTPLTDAAFWKGHTADQMKAVQKVLGEEIPKREEAEREKDIADGRRLFEKHGVDPEAITALLKGKTKPQE
jgi:hypothetical protein